jgi:K+-transporting ATPase KdpF subunit
MTVNWMEALAALVALGLFAYLGYALLRPEKF